MINLRQQDPAERAVVDQVKQREYTQALERLGELGKVVVDRSPADLAARLARDYQTKSDRREQVSVGVVTHRARLAVNDAIVNERRKAGEFESPDHGVTILEPAQWTRAQIQSVVSYADTEDRHRVPFRRDYRSLGVRRGDAGRVIRVDEETRAVALDVGGRRVDWQPHKNAEVEVYREASRSIAVGDRIVIR